MFAPDQFPVSPRRNELFGMWRIAIWIASSPSSRILALQAFRRLGDRLA